MSNGNSSTGGGYNYYQSSDLQAYQQSTSYNQANSYYDPAAIAIANATGNMAGHHHHQIGSNTVHLHPRRNSYPSSANPNQQQNQQNQQQQQPSQQANQKLNKGKARTTIIRKAGGEVWEDQTLMEWDPAHFRLFVGDLAPEVSDDGLAAAFSKWNPEDFMKAWKEMNGKYVGSRPIKISKATTKVGVVQIGNKKARALDDHRKKKLIQGVERLRTGAGAVWKNDNRPYARR
ncbi:hypothetical protein KEM48_011557 [Puccinia striiformis f. sp. tritici PST-130]|nr:hypothetical protein KEM48_011557 [Puccinia striiformis f. sp. tritici PST-130]